MAYLLTVSHLGPAVDIILLLIDINVQKLDSLKMSLMATRPMSID